MVHKWLCIGFTTCTHNLLTTRTGEQLNGRSDYTGYTHASNLDTCYIYNFVRCIVKIQNHPGQMIHRIHLIRTEF